MKDEMSETEANQDEQKEFNLLESLDLMTQISPLKHKSPSKIYTSPKSQYIAPVSAPNTPSRDTRVSTPSKLSQSFTAEQSSDEEFLNQDSPLNEELEPIESDNFTK